MAKQAKAEAKPEPKPEPKKVVEAEPEITLAAAIREGFKSLPEAVDPNNRDATRALKKWIADTYPALADSVESKSFGSTLNGQRKKAGGGGDDEAPVSSRGGSVGEPTFPEVLKARDLCKELEMTPEALLSVLEEVARFGDPAKLKKCLSYAKMLGHENNG